jgi:hypothetical protein
MRFALPPYALALGVFPGRLVTVVSPTRSEPIRIISFRRARHEERRTYQELYHTELKAKRGESRTDLSPVDTITDDAGERFVAENEDELACMPTGLRRN